MANSEVIALVCGDCKCKNYTRTRNRKAQTEKLSVNKFCPACRKHTTHKESKAA